MDHRTPSDIASSTAALLDDALLDLLVNNPNPRAQALRRRQRIAGITLLILASMCIAAIAALSPSTASLVVGTSTLGTLAVLLMFIGAWLIDRAGKQELHERRDGFAGDLGESLNEPSQAMANRQRYFGISMLALAVFSVCVATAPLPGKGQFDAFMWAGFSIILIAIGAWQIERAFKAARRAQELADVVRRRKAAQAGSHLRRLP